MNVHFSSQRHNWKTPKKFYEELDKEFKFDYDPCPDNPNSDGLTTSWGQVNFVNPPYKHIKTWIAKAYLEHLSGKTVVMLIPSRTDTIWWHDYVMKANEIRFIKGRIYFDNGNGRAPFPSAIVVFNRRAKEKNNG